MIGSAVFTRLLVLAGLVASMSYGGGPKRNYWTTGTNRFGINGAQHDPERVARAEAKREMRRAKVRRAVAAGGYGPNPYVVKGAA